MSSRRANYDSFASAALSVNAQLGENPEVTPDNPQADSLQRSASFTGVTEFQELLHKRKRPFESPVSDK